MTAGEVKVVFCNEDVAVYEKPSGLPTTRPDEGPCLVNEVRRLDPRAPLCHPTSRLDAEVSGLVTFARTDKGNAALMKARRTGHYGRLYLALATGAPEEDRGQWTESIGIDPRDKRKRVAWPRDSKMGRVAGRAPQSAETSFEVVTRLPKACLLALRPHTGRTHQLRVHASHAGLPLLGDVHYDGARKVIAASGRVWMARRVQLHCAALRIRLSSELTLALSARPPEDFQALYRGLGGEAADLSPERFMAYLPGFDH